MVSSETQYTANTEPGDLPMQHLEYLMDLCFVLSYFLAETRLGNICIGHMTAYDQGLLERSFRKSTGLFDWSTVFLKRPGTYESVFFEMTVRYELGPLKGENTKRCIA